MLWLQLVLLVVVRIDLLISISSICYSRGWALQHGGDPTLIHSILIVPGLDRRALVEAHTVVAHLITIVEVVSVLLVAVLIGGRG